MELNRDDIIKALECISRTGDVLCEGCSYRKYDGLACHRIGAKNAISLINELTEENAKLARSCTELTQECKKWQSRLKIECEYTKSDTVRKMQERLKAEKFTHKNFGELVYVDDIDQIANELLEKS